MSAGVLVGILDDGERSDDVAEGGIYSQMQLDMELAVDERTAAGRIDHPVEWVYARGAGLPGGTAHAVETAFTALVDQGALLVVGPAIGDNAIVATPLADHHRTPAINWSASERARGEWMFHLQVGSHEDESILMAPHLAGQGLERIGVVYDRTTIGRRHLAFFEAECELLGVNAATRVSIPPLPDAADQEVEAVRRERVDGLVCLGLGWPAARSPGCAGRRPRTQSAARRPRTQSAARRPRISPGGGRPWPLASKPGWSRPRSSRPPRATTAPPSASAGGTGAPARAATWCCDSGATGCRSSCEPAAHLDRRSTWAMR